MAFKVPEIYRIRTGEMASDGSYGNNGAFFIPHQKIQYARLVVIASNGEGWEHVSVTLSGKNLNRCPIWDEMCFIKDLFWDDTDCVLQFHPPKSEYVNNHAYCLHLWRPTNQTIPIPDTNLVGVK